jgi:hypothetical protein
MREDSPVSTGNIVAVSKVKRYDTVVEFISTGFFDCHVDDPLRVIGLRGACYDYQCYDGQ